MAGTKTKVALAAAVAVLLTGSVSTMVYVARKPAAKTVVVKATPSSSELAQVSQSPDPNPNRATAMSKSAARLRQMGLGALMYANAQKDGSLPPDIGTLFLTQDLDATIFLDPRRNTRLPPEVAAVPAKQKVAWLNEHSDFLYFGAGRNNAMKSTELLAMEKPGDLPRQPGKDIDEINILFGDGHVEAWPADRAIELMEKTIREQEQRK